MPRNPLKPPTEAQLAARAAGAERLRHLASIRKSVDASEHIEDGKPRDLKSTGPAREALDPPQIEVVERVRQDKLEVLKFMEEPVTVLVAESTNPHDTPVIEVWNGGRKEFFLRGQEKVVRRKFVEVLARMKKTVYSQRLEKDANGVEFYRNIPHTASQHPFAVIEDTPKGREWLKGIMKEA
jgi:hypothetical protein